MKTEDPRLSALNFLCGNWQTEGEILGDSGEVVDKITGIDSYEWVSGGCFLLHRVDVLMGDTKTEVIEVIGSYDSTDDSYAMRSFGNDGNFITMKGRFEKDGVFKIEGEGIRSTLVYNQSEQSMTISWERLQDGSLWKPWLNMKLSKLTT
jgi:hypothetical protein